MGPLFVIIFGVLLGAVVGAGVGMALCFIGVSVYYALRKTPKELRKITLEKKGILVFAFVGVFAVIGGAAPLAVTIMEIINSDDFEKATGLGEWCRMPLEYPYEMCTIAGHQDADIRTWKEEKYVVRRVTRYHRKGSLLAGEYQAVVREPKLLLDADTIRTDGAKANAGTYSRIDPGLHKTGWFVFDMSSGTVCRYDTHEEYLSGLDQFGFADEPELRTIWQNWRW